MPALMANSKSMMESHASPSALMLAVPISVRCGGVSRFRDEVMPPVIDEDLARLVGSTSASQMRLIEVRAGDGSGKTSSV